ncbi:unnamed protein product [Ectocarpus sp. 12 AP-2014]
MAGDVVRLIRSCGVLDTNLTFRHPVPDLSSFEEKEARLMLDLPATGLRIKEWSAIYASVSPRDIERRHLTVHGRSEQTRRRGLAAVV